MARGQGKGQKFDKFWRKLNDLSEKTMTFETIEQGEEIKHDLDLIFYSLLNTEPTSDYEIKDKENLLNQLIAINGKVYIGLYILKH